MTWDKRATVRRPGSAPPRRASGMNIVYLGITEDARDGGIDDGRMDEASGLRIGDVFRLLPGAAITFGRSQLCEVTILSDQLSRAHAMVAYLPGSESELVVVDLKSRNGTWVNGRNLPVQRLGPGSEFTLAKTHRFRCQPAQER